VSELNAKMSKISKLALKASQRYVASVTIARDLIIELAKHDEAKALEFAQTLELISED
jgi:hypothetical protein